MRRSAAVTPAVVPTKQAVLGDGRLARGEPSSTVQTRTVVARAVPPAPPPPFEATPGSHQGNGGSAELSAQSARHTYGSTSGHRDRETCSACDAGGGSSAGPTRGVAIGRRRREPVRPVERDKRG